MVQWPPWAAAPNGDQAVVARAKRRHQKGVLTVPVPDVAAAPRREHRFQTAFCKNGTVVRVRGKMAVFVELLVYFGQLAEVIAGAGDRGPQPRLNRRR